MSSLCWFAVLAGCGGSSSPALSPPGSPPPPPPPAVSVATEPVFAALSMQSPVALLQAPGDTTRWFVVEQRGVVRAFPNQPSANDGDASVFVDLRARVESGGERGLLGMAFDPGFGTGNHDVYLSYTRLNGGLESVVSRFRSLDNGLTLDSGVEEILLTVPQDAGNHNGGHLAFGPDGLLYAGFGDGGGAGDPLDRGQDTSNLLATIVRIDVHAGMPYAIPPDNPFAANAANPCTLGFGGADCPEIFAWGLRNPWRWSFDRQTGNLWAGDVGQGQWEEVDRIVAGGNYGWNDREGAHCFEPPSGCLTNSTDPVTEYDRSLGQSITGGFVYRGSAIAALQGRYVYGDFVSGRLFAIPADSPLGSTGQMLLDTPLSIVSFAEDHDGELLVIDYSGSIHRLIDAL